MTRPTEEEKGVKVRVLTKRFSVEILDKDKRRKTVIALPQHAANSVPTFRTCKLPNAGFREMANLKFRQKNQGEKIA